MAVGRPVGTDEEVGHLRICLIQKHLEELSAHPLPGVSLSMLSQHVLPGHLSVYIRSKSTGFMI